MSSGSYFAKNLFNDNWDGCPRRLATIWARERASNIGPGKCVGKVEVDNPGCTFGVGDPPKYPKCYERCKVRARARIFWSATTRK